MTRAGWYLAAAGAFALHNLEEGLFAPQLLDFLRIHGPARSFYASIAAGQFRFQLAVLTAFSLLLALLAARFPAHRGWAAVMLVFAALTGLNAVAHVVLMLAAGEWMPGFVTSVLLTLPVSVAMFRRAAGEGWVSRAPDL